MKRKIEIIAAIIILIFLHVSITSASEKEYDVSECKIGDNILRKQINGLRDDIENIDYHILETNSFYKGHAFAKLEEIETEDDEYSENNESGNISWGYIGEYPNRHVLCNISREFDCDDDNLEYEWDPYGNSLINFFYGDKQIFLFRDGIHYVEFDTDKISVKYCHDGYYIFEINADNGYIHNETEYGMFDYDGNVIMRGKAEDLPIQLEKYVNGWGANYGAWFLDGNYDLYNVRTEKTINYGFAESNSILGESEYGDVFLVERENDFAVFDENGNQLCNFDIDNEYGADDYGRVSKKMVAFTNQGYGEIYSINGKKIFSNENIGDVIIEDIVPKDIGYAVVLLKGTEDTTNYITVVDLNGNICFEPMECVVGIEYEDIDIGTLLSDMGYLTVPQHEGTQVVNLDGKEIATLEEKTAEPFQRGGISVGTNYWSGGDDILESQLELNNIVYVEDTKKGSCGSNLEWTLYENGTLEINGNGKMDNWESAENVPWNDYRNLIKKIVIENGVTEIGSWAFWNCPYVFTVEIPESVVAIREFAFASCLGLRKIKIPDTVTTIGKSAFAYCINLYDVTLPSKINKLSESVLDSAGILDLKIPDNILEIEDGALRNTQMYKVEIPQNVTKIGSYAFTGSVADKIIIQGNISEIKERTFDTCSYLSEVKLPDSITSIERGAFGVCSELSKIVLPEKLKKLGESVFYSCDKLSEITIPSSLTKIDQGAFEMCDNLNIVYYMGSEKLWKKINIGDDNEALLDAEIQYNN